MIERRVERLRLIMKERGYPAVLITKPENRYYLSGFTGSTAYLIITQDQAQLLTDFRYVEQATKEVPLYKVVRGERSLIEKLKDLVKDFEALAFEAGDISYSSYQEFKEAFQGVDLVPTQGLVEEMRLLKDEEELSYLREAVKRSDDAFTHILSFLKPGVEEREIALELEYFMKREGAQRIPFGIIVASGERGSLPHGLASHKKLEEGDLITMDFGSCSNGYFSDMTRTVALSPISSKQREIYQLVLKAQSQAIDAARAGLTGEELDQIARQIIEEASMGQYFGHGLGHGVGLEIHEGPRLGQTSQDLLQERMVVTIEPGIYIPDLGGVRIEDMIVIEREGREVLTESKKELIIL